jgi:hypothetical protein
MGPIFIPYGHDAENWGDRKEIADLAAATDLIILSLSIFYVTLFMTNSFERLSLGL